MIEGQPRPQTLALAADQLFWNAAEGTTTGGWSLTIRSASVTDSSISVIVTEAYSPVTLTVDNDFVYWVNEPNLDASATNGQIMKSALSGGTPTVLADNQALPYGEPGTLVTDDSSVYWADRGTRTIMQVTKSGGTPGAIVSNTSAAGVAVDQDYIYWADGTAVYRELKAGGAPEKLVDGGANATWADRVISSSSALFYQVHYGGDNGQIVIYRLDKVNESPPQVLVGPSRYIQTTRMAAINGYVYWAESGLIRRIPWGGGATEDIAALQGHELWDLAVGSDSVYWTDVYDGVIRRVTL